MRWLRRWWGRFTHRHEYEVIWRGTWWFADEKDKAKPLILKRCTCGHELARKWVGDATGWQDVDLEWFNYHAHEKQFDIPARHQE